MGQADSTIKGFLYQFDKSLLEILVSDEGETITLEGQIEDIDITSTTGVETIQCKYHEDRDYSMSSVAEPILEMLCHYITHQVIGRNTKYVLYAHFKNNVETVEQSDLEHFISNTKNQDIIVKYLPQIFNISDNAILLLVNKAKKTRDDKKQIVAYFIANRTTLSYKMPIASFFERFEYRRAEKHETLKQRITEELTKYVDLVTANELYYPNAFARIAEMSSLPNSAHRKITKSELWDWLNSQKTLLVNKWIFEIRNRKDVLKSKKAYLSSMFSLNPDIRAFVLSKSFLDSNKYSLAQFIIAYINKYYIKRKLQRPPIFILETQETTLLNSIILDLFKYQITVNNGLVGYAFIEDSFIGNNNCPKDFSVKLTLMENINKGVLQKCNVNYLFYIGYQIEPITDTCFRTETLGIHNISEFRYLIGLDKTLEEELQ